MAEETHVIRGINWRETFPFVNIFRSFRIAIHPSKLILALIALLCIYTGGRILDSVWPAHSLGVNVPDSAEFNHARSEVAVYEIFMTKAKPGDRFEKLREEVQKMTDSEYADRLLAAKLPEIKEDRAKAEEAAKNGSFLGDLKRKIIADRDEAVKKDRETYDKSVEAIKKAFDASDKKDPAAKTRDEDFKKAEEHRDNAIKLAYSSAETEYKKASAIKGQGLFAQFFEYESQQVNGVVYSVLANNWLGGLRGDPGTAGVFASTYNFFAVGPLWLMRVHLAYFLVFSLLFILVWALFGGAIARIAAIQVARDEKLSVRQALKFSCSKLLSFVFAPIIPLLIVIVVGLVVTVGGLVGSIPVIGPILVGVLFFLAIAAGFVMTLVLMGTGGGFNLMYPTIAVEGSDSFDAISRSFSYVYARPWRMLFYTIVAVIYGALTFLFVRMFVFLMLTLTHKFVGFGLVGHADNLRPLWDTMWPAPTARLAYDIDYMSLGGAQAFAATLVAIWVYLTISIIGAYAISFYFSANTVIYYLMRREVDATELDDVYIEQSEDDFAEHAPAAPSPAPAPAAASAPVESKPVENPPVNP